MREYWNHNTAYHPWLIGIAGAHCGDVLDVGCGDGLLAQRLLPVSRSVTAIDPDPDVVRQAQSRLTGRADVSPISFQQFGPVEPRFDVITFVATLHHMDLRTSLSKARELLRPGGELAVVGLAANRSAGDWIWSALWLPAVRIGSLLHRDTRDIGVAVAQPRESLREIRRVADGVVPGAVVRRALYYRYLLRWRKPSSAPRPDP
ncbi:bifunctional 2-polyprenyl-6-hydroxyphenol methylase/3-demethylubiquinol 3-O-methyltransferase UbiG [Mycobacterium sp. NAZ190054]|uniref:class I SAM-dependent methyltransferase n=1 Tax=Mycobacterium sp. NAZ190054 TaxID=1747766 RepID=UPI000794D9FE|nr:class I SAM-dependent methyltransferase [Mycobacterium sp. NAZ190054]KWX57406.1 SAM-dependent methyltransferase [Mycobacterium sp. NAZ190054]